LSAWAPVGPYFVKRFTRCGRRGPETERFGLDARSPKVLGEVAARKGPTFRRQDELFRRLNRTQEVWTKVLPVMTVECVTPLLFVVG